MRVGCPTASSEIRPDWPAAACPGLTRTRSQFHSHPDRRRKRREGRERTRHDGAAALRRIRPGDGTVDVLGVHEPKAEMRDAPTETGGGGVLGEGDDVVPARSLSVDESISAPVLAQTDLFV